MSPNHICKPFFLKPLAKYVCVMYVCVCMCQYIKFGFGNDLSELLERSFKWLCLLFVLLYAYMSEIGLLIISLGFSKKVPISISLSYYQTVCFAFYLNNMVSLELGNL